jgi:hypothetical protein
VVTCHADADDYCWSHGDGQVKISTELANLHHHRQRTTQSRSAFPQGLTMIYALLIINKAGGLVYNREYNEGISRLSSNDYLVLAGTFHG